ncbi:MAG: hypothetical protein LBU83_07365 [Bacteroidales bacterium]|jgi:hypothetical protein|nr:hypothetical protein [Bacteroidales bacterium]
MGKQKALNEMRNYTEMMEKQHELYRKQLAAADDVIKTQAEVILKYEETIAVQKELIKVLQGAESYDE